MDYNVIIEGGKIAGALIAIFSVVGMIFKFIVLKPLKKFITDTIAEYTKPIQKESNGGFSLPDANKKLNKLADRLDKLEEENHKRLDAMEDILSQVLDTVTKPRTRTKKVIEETE